MVATCLAKRAISELFTQQVRAPERAVQPREKDARFISSEMFVECVLFPSSLRALFWFFFSSVCDSRIYQEIFASNNMRSRVLLLTLTDAVHCAFFPSTITS